MTYTPRPLDTSKVSLPPELAQMTELFAKNTHDVWARQRIAEGWRHGPERDDKKKLHPGLVPYEELSEKEKDYDRRTAMEAIRFIVQCGYAINRVAQPAPSCHVAEGKRYAIVTDSGSGGIVLPKGNYPVLWTSNKQLPDEAVFGRITNRCFLMLDADVLRKSGAMISKSVSWERSAENLLWQLAYNPALTRLLRAPHILITFAEDGAIYIKTKDGKLGEAWLTLNHNGPEGSLREQGRGGGGDAFSVMAAVAALQFPDVMSGKKAIVVRPILEMGAEQIMSGGQSSAVDKKDYKIEISKASTGAPDGIKIPVDRGVPVPVNTWVIASDKYKGDMSGLAERYIKTGKIDDKDFPMLTIGKLKTIDRGEIEDFSNISNVIKMYYGNREADKPLSIAVFGKPGSGKSFGVKQIAKFVLPKDTIEDITFNVSQFSRNSDDLGVAFQQVRDIIMRGKLPLVFFDEFDSDERSWLKSFLMPMQDGKFKDQSGEHPLGKCILVFAGGTAPTFKDFQSGINTEESKALKLPDFVSRIKGSIDIAGPNPRNNEDANYILRRALLLRGMCEQDKRMDKNDAGFIDDTIIRAMLLVPEFKHGVRSMETIREMSNITSGKWVPAALPLGDQLSLHVDTRAFTDLLLFDIIIESEVGVMARKIHEFFRSHLDKVADKSHPSNVAWEDLPWHFKLDNLNAARAYPGNVAKFGGYINWKDASGEVLELTDERVVERLAIEEHNRWWERKEKEGWTPGKPRDDAKKIHDCMFPWEELDEKTKDKDRNPIREIPFVLDAVGRRVFKR